MTNQTKHNHDVPTETLETMETMETTETTETNIMTSVPEQMQPLAGVQLVSSGSIDIISTRAYSIAHAHVADRL